MPPPKPFKPVRTTPAVDPIIDSAEVIILEATAYKVVSRLPSGTVRLDKLQATADEVAALKVIDQERKAQRAEAYGSNVVTDAPEPIPAGSQFSVDSLIEQDVYKTVTKLNSETIRTDRHEATEEERAEDLRVRQINNVL